MATWKSKLDEQEMAGASTLQLELEQNLQVSGTDLRSHLRHRPLQQFALAACCMLHFGQLLLCTVRATFSCRMRWMCADPHTWQPLNHCILTRTSPAARSASPSGIQPMIVL